MSWRTVPMPPGWARTKARIIARDQGICYICRQPGADEVDHVEPVSRGGSEADDNLKAAHSACHKRKTWRESVGGSRKRPPERHPGDIGSSPERARGIGGTPRGGPNGRSRQGPQAHRAAARA